MLILWGTTKLKEDLHFDAPDDGCEYCESGWCKNQWGSLCPHYLEINEKSGRCEKVL